MYAKVINVALNGIKYSETTINGQSAIVLPNNLVSGSYVYSVSFDSADTYLATSANINVVVYKNKSVLSASKKTYNVKTKTKKYTAILKSATGSAIAKIKVTLKVKCKTYKATTTSKCQATLKLPN